MSDKQHPRSRHSSIVGNSVPFPDAVPSLTRQLSDLSLIDLGSLGYSYPAAYARITRDSTVSHRPKIARRSSAGSTYSQRTQRGAQQLSPVAEENESRRTRSPTSPVAPRYPSVITHMDPFAEDITFAMMMMMPSPRVEMRRSAAKKRRAKQSKAQVAAKRAAGVTKRVVASVGRAIFCPPWQWARP
ncbi:hypothetical protein FA95DRAFT_1555306 [Auriscalpium vulgare]|uniref:Uncharacterized protein n=1 Tax=Auriscalpium vulgare TaxID=40419 RepID=A0ACB8S3R9_9AGAM|nr:hypothetical protein FA95DRAFT_1555306 [Auriscalpium vulgare]